MRPSSGDETMEAMTAREPFAGERPAREHLAVVALQRAADLHRDCRTPYRRPLRAQIRAGTPRRPRGMADAVAATGSGERARRGALDAAALTEASMQFFEANGVATAYQISGHGAPLVPGAAFCVEQLLRPAKYGFTSSGPTGANGSGARARRSRPSAPRSSSIPRTRA